MPMIIKNNVRYCSTGGDAESIVYNNTESGMEATNMQDAIDELNSNLLKIRVFDKISGELTAASTAFGGYVGHVDITSDIADITDNIVAKTAISLGEVVTKNLCGFCAFQGDSNTVRIFSNRPASQTIRVTVFYI